MQARVEHLLMNCRSRSREIAFACALLFLSLLAVAVGLFLRTSGWFREDRTLIGLHDAAHGSLRPGVGSGASSAKNEDDDRDAEEDIFLIEDSMTGETIKRNLQARGDNFKRWTRYKLVDSYEMSGRLVAGLKESKSALIRIQPKGVQVPNVEQLREIAERYNSREHYTTYVYFYLPGMELKQNPWATVFQQANCPTSVSFDKTNVPELYRRFEDQAAK